MRVILEVMEIPVKYGLLVERHGEVQEVSWKFTFLHEHVKDMTTCGWQMMRSI